MIDHLPGFRMYDPWVTREITIRDLLVHRSGLGPGQGDLMFVPSTDISRADLVRRIRFLKPKTSFRSAYAYDNVLYAVAGQVVEDVSGQTWEDFVEARIFAPLGMKSAVTNDVDRLAAPNRAFPHGRVGELRGVGAQQVLDEKKVALGANVGPAGAIATGANDIARWLQVQLAAGQLPGSEDRLFTADSAGEMWQPVVPVPITRFPPPLEDAAPQFRGYALGWSVQDYRGHKIIQHGGGTLGFRAIVVLIPEKNVAYAIAMNSEDNEFTVGLHYELLDHYLGLPKRDWPGDFRTFFDCPQCRRTRGAARGGCRAREVLALAAARGLCRRVRRPVVRADRDHGVERVAHDRLQADARHGRPARALGVRHVRRALAGSPHGARLRDICARCLRQTGAHHDEGLLAGRGLQLRLPRPRVHAGRAAGRDAADRIKKGPAQGAGPLQSQSAWITRAAARPRTLLSSPAVRMPSVDPRKPRRRSSRPS